MKKFLLAIGMMAAALSASAIGLERLGIANHLSVGVGVGTTGISFEASTPITRFVQARLGMAVLPGIRFTTSADVDYDYQGYTGESQIDLTGSFKRLQGSIIFNVYPFPVGSFYVAAGAYFGGSDLLKITGTTNDPNFRDGDVIIGDYTVPIKDGRVDGGLKVKSFRPYVGIGWGRAVPSRRINFNVELGVQIHGKPRLYSNTGEINLSEQIDDDDFQKIMDKVKVWPVLKFTLNGRIF